MQPKAPRIDLRPICQDCQQPIPLGKDLTYNGRPLCLNCADHGYVTCSACGTLLNDEGDTQYCDTRDDYLCAACWQKLPQNDREKYI